MDLVKLVQEHEAEIASGNYKTNDAIVVTVKDVQYLIPQFCLTGALWGMPDSFYPCNKYEWADHPLYFTTVEMVKAAITGNVEKFKAFILYQPVRNSWDF